MPTRSSQLTGRCWPTTVVVVAVCLVLGGVVRAAPEASKDFQPELRFSTYQPTKLRDPFGGTRATAGSSGPVSSGPAAFQLQGILYDTKNPMAIVNNQPVALNKLVKVPVGGSEIEVKAVELTREKVVLEVGGKRLELWLSNDSDLKSGPHNNNPN
jgi:hypothetical protein